LPNYRENVCTNREESVESEEKPSDSGNDQQGFQHHFSVNVESCSETPSKHICKRITNIGGSKKTVTTTSTCCYGFRRGRGGFCEKIDLLTMAQIGEQLESKQFVSSIEKNDLKDMMESNVTVFMPADDSFGEFSQHVTDNNLVVAPLRSRRQEAGNSLTMKDVLRNHIVRGMINIEDIDNEQILNTEYENSTIRMNVFPKIRSINREDDGYHYLYTANCVPIIKPNMFATNAIVHKIPSVLMPVTQNVMEIIRAREDMTILRTVLEKTKMDKMLEGLELEEDDDTKSSAPKQFSIFAPTDSAFEKIDPQLKRKIKEGAACAESE
jgi:transforming growth factor-beta-induced protein